MNWQLFWCSKAVVIGGITALMLVSSACRTTSEQSDDDPGFDASVQQPGEANGEDSDSDQDRAVSQRETVHQGNELSWEPSVPQGGQRIEADDADSQSESDTEADGSTGPPTASLSPDDVTDEDIEAFAAAYTDVIDLKHRIESRHRQTSTPQEEAGELRERLNRRSVELVEQQGLSPAQFNAIVELLDDHDDLRDRVQTEIDTLAQ